MTFRYNSQAVPIKKPENRHTYRCRSYADAFEQTGYAKGTAYNYPMIKLSKLFSVLEPFSAHTYCTRSMLTCRAAPRKRALYSSLKTISVMCFYYRRYERYQQPALNVYHTLNQSLLADKFHEKELFLLVL